MLGEESSVGGGVKCWGRSLVLGEESTIGGRSLVLGEESSVGGGV